MVEIKAYFCKGCKAPLPIFNYSSVKCEYCDTIHYKEGFEPIKKNDSGYKVPVIIHIKNKSNKAKCVPLFKNNLHILTSDLKKRINDSEVEIKVNNKDAIEETDRLIELNFISSLFRITSQQRKSGVYDLWHYNTDQNGQIFENFIVTQPDAYQYNYGSLIFSAEIALRNTICMLLSLLPNEEVRIVVFAKHTIDSFKKAYASAGGGVMNTINSGGSGGSAAFTSNSIFIVNSILPK